MGMAALALGRQRDQARLAFKRAAKQAEKPYNPTRLSTNGTFT
jgi:hypothetical protein